MLAVIIVLTLKHVTTTTGQVATQSKIENRLPITVTKMHLDVEVVSGTFFHPKKVDRL